LEGTEGEYLKITETEYLANRKEYFVPKEEIAQGTVEECTMRASVCAL